jgi:hypothetical protein
MEALSGVLGSNYQGHLTPAALPPATAVPGLQGPNETHRGVAPSPRPAPCPMQGLLSQGCLPGHLPLIRTGFRAAWILALIKRKCPPGAIGLGFLSLLGTFVQPQSWSLVPG